MTNGIDLHTHPETLLVCAQRTRMWSFPKGRRHFDEHPLAAAMREFSEETGLQPRHLQMFAHIFVDEWDAAHQAYTRYFLALANNRNFKELGRFRFDKNELREVRYVVHK